MRSPGHLSSRLFPRWQTARRVRSAALILLGSAQCRGVKNTHVVVQQNRLISNKETLWQGIFNKGQRELSCPIRLRTRVGASDTDVPRRQGRGLWVVTPGLAPGRPCQRGVPGCGLVGTLPAGAVVTGWRARSKRGEVTVLGPGDRLLAHVVAFASVSHGPAAHCGLQRVERNCFMLFF